MADLSSSHRLVCVLVTPEQKLFEREADFVTLPALDGELGVLPRRAPLVTRLAPGELRFKPAGSDQFERYYVDGGFAQVRDNVVTVLANRAKRVSDIADADYDKQYQDEIAVSATTDEAYRLKQLRLARIRAQRRLLAKKSSV